MIVLPLDPIISNHYNIGLASTDRKAGERGMFEERKAMSKKILITLQTEYIVHNDADDDIVRAQVRKALHHLTNSKSAKDLGLEVTKVADDFSMARKTKDGCFVFVNWKADALSETTPNTLKESESAK